MSTCSGKVGTSLYLLRLIYHIHTYISYPYLYVTSILIYHIHNYLSYPYLYVTSILTYHIHNYISYPYSYITSILIYHIYPYIWHITIDTHMAHHYRLLSLTISIYDSNNYPTISTGKFVTLPDKTSNYPQRISYKEYKFDEMSTNLSSPIIRKRIKAFGGHRQNVEYSPDLHPLKLINFPGHEPHRILQHHYGKSCVYVMIW